VTESQAEPTQLDVLVPRDLAAASTRLILTRWAAGALVLLATFASQRLFGVVLPADGLYLTGMAILIYNAALTVQARRAASPDPAVYLQRLRRLVVLQVGLDWLCMAVFLHLTGGITSPAIVFLLIHMLMVAILLPGVSSYLYVALGVGGLLVLALLEAGGILPHYTVLAALPRDLYRDPLFITAQIVFFAAAAFATVTLATGILVQLQRRERQISALFQTTRAVSSSLSLNEVLDHLTRNAALALSTGHSSIRLLDEAGETLELAAAFGLSKAYQEKGRVDLTHNPLAKEALAGRAVIVNDVTDDARLQYARQVLQEGIHSLVVVPIIGRSGPLGVLRVYADQARRFSDADAQFVTTIARQGAVAIENAMAHEALQRAESERAQFVRSVTHELRSPVGGAQSLLRVLLQQMSGELNPTQQDIIARVEARLEALMALINDLLALAATTTRGFQETPEALDLLPQVRTAVELRTAEAQEKHVTLEVSLPDQPVYVRAGVDGLAHIFGNLVGNAVKYTPEGGQVRVAAEVRGPSVHVAISDTGIGIPEDELPRLWQEFFRASNARKSGIVGTGLGLSIVKRRVEAYGGMISVTSRVGEGTTFSVSLPTCAAPSPPAG
jgi:signal transduction histidine kinase